MIDAVPPEVPDMPSINEVTEPPEVSEISSPQHVPEPPGKKAMPTAQKWLLGCGIGCLVLTILSIGGCAVIGFVGKTLLEKVQEKVEQYSQDYVSMGFEKQEEQFIAITTPISGKKLFVATTVDIDADCDSDIAIMATDATIRGHIAGNVHFKGQQITIAPNAIIDGNLDVAAAAVYIRGVVNGEIEGVYTKLVEGQEEP